MRIATVAAPAARPTPGPGRLRTPPPRQVEVARPTRDGQAPHGAFRVAAAFHPALGDLAARTRPQRRASAAAQGARTLRLPPIAVEGCDAPRERLAAALRRTPAAEPAERGGEDLLRQAPLRTFARVLGGDGADAETRTAWRPPCAVLAAAAEGARPDRAGASLSRAA